MAAKLKIVLLGATGQTGQPLLRLCLERGHQVIIIIIILIIIIFICDLLNKHHFYTLHTIFQVVAVVRSKTANLGIKHENLRREEADIFSCESLTPIFRGQDVVISALGFPKQLDEKMTKFTESMSAVLEAMRKASLIIIVFNCANNFCH